MQSSQDFIRALKAQSDPPSPTLPSKIEIAQLVWNKPAMYVPCKGTVIAEWILTRLLKDKSTEPESNPLLDVRYWALLNDIITQTDDRTTRNVKKWLICLLSRIPIALIVVSFLDMLSILEYRWQEITSVVCRCLTIIWPLSAPKFSPESLMECFCAILKLLHLSAKDESLARICCLVASSYRSYQANSPNSRKLLSMFLETTLQTWMTCAAAASQCQGYHRNLLDHIDAIGIEALFCLDNLRRHRDPSFFNHIFDKFEEIASMSPSLFLDALPHIFSSYIRCLRQYRSALYAQGGHRDVEPTERLRADGMSFFVMCNSLIDKFTFVEQAWSARRSLLCLVEQEDLFSVFQRDAESSLKQLGHLAVDTLNEIDKRECINAELALETLCILHRIDFDILGQTIVPKILSTLLSTEIPHCLAISYLNLLVDYHSKTKTLPSYIRMVFNALDLPPASLEVTKPVYNSESLGPLVHASHLNTLGKWLHAGLAPSQLLEVVQIAVQSLQDAWAKLPSFHSKNDRLRRADKTENDAKLVHESHASAGLSLSLIVKVAIVVLPLKPTSKAVEQDIQRIVDGMQMTLIHHSLRRVLRRIRKRRSENEWTAQIVASSLLNLWYTLTTSRCLIPRRFNHKNAAKLLDCGEDHRIIPELSVEIFRSLLCDYENQSQDHTRRLLATLLVYLSHNLAGYSRSQLGQDDQHKSKAASSLLHMVIQRWLPVLDNIASHDDLKQLVELLICNGQYLQVQKNPCLTEALCSAQLWELMNLRRAVLSYLSEATSVMDNVDAMSYFQEHQTVITGSISSRQMETVITAFGVALFIPFEYLTQICRTDLVRRAIVADVFISSLEPSENQDTAPSQSLVTLRIFVRRTVTDPSLGFDHLTRSSLAMSHAATNRRIGVLEYVEHLLNDNDDFRTTPEYMSSTLDLIEDCFAILLKDKTKVLAVAGIFTSFIQMNHASSCAGSIVHPHNIKLSAFLRFVALITRSCSRNEFPDDFLASMRVVYNHFYPILTSQLSILIAKGSAANSDGHLLDTWCHILMLERWLQLGPVKHRFGRNLVSILIQDHHSTSGSRVGGTSVTLTATVFQLLLEEFHTYEAMERISHLNAIIAMYIALCRLCNAIERSKLDVLVSGAAKQFTILEISHTFEFVLESLSGPHGLEADLAPLVRLLTLLSHRTPEGTMKIVQRTATRSFNVFAECDSFTRGPPDLRLEVLHFITKLCSDRPAALRLVDLGNIWLLLGKVLCGYPQHDAETSHAIFHHVVGIVSSMIRLRQDLVVSTLPHLATILRQLMASMRHPRPQLGAKQHKLVTDTLPQWLNPASPITSVEGVALGRLLSTLTTKSIARARADHRKVESLAKPFSKHAIFVLTAYIDIMNDPLCVVPLEIRKALQPGLFSLCDMLNECSRDALMASMPNSDKKTTMKSLWREYEKQRYAGEG